ncbi:MAG TPA: hypothetical protein VHL59_01970 [Thermoanaerobaculia bacterium]|nr:hypothetical protein [Thermoanaerobaculia bacterium]
MATKADKEGSERSSRKKSSSSRSHTLRNVVTSAAATETLIDLVDRLGLVDVVLGRVKSRIEETDLDELFDEVADYLKRNPEVLVVSLGALTVATGMLVFLNSRREWDGNERRRTGSEYSGSTTTSSGRVRRAS